jgi:hypothetical protein
MLIADYFLKIQNELKHTGFTRFLVVVCNIVVHDLFHYYHYYYLMLIADYFLKIRNELKHRFYQVSCRSLQ